MATTSPTSTRPRVLIKQPLTLRSSTRASFLPDNPSQRAGRLMATRSSERRFMVIASLPFGYLSADNKANVLELNSMTASSLVQVFFAIGFGRIISVSGQIDSRDRTRAFPATSENSCAPCDSGSKKVAGIFQEAV